MRKLPSTLLKTSFASQLASNAICQLGWADYRTDRRTEQKYNSEFQFTNIEHMM